MTKLPVNTALIIVDVQKFFHNPRWGKRNNPQAEENIDLLIKQWRNTGRPVYHIQHVEGEYTPPRDFMDFIHPQPGEPIFRKSVNSSFIGTNLESALRENGIETVVIVGLTTNHFLETTEKMAGKPGLKAIISIDSTSNFYPNLSEGVFFKVAAGWTNHPGSRAACFLRPRNAATARARFRED